jgi:hypothetical protein
MSGHEIPRDHWREELDAFSRSHEGWLVRVVIEDTEGHRKVETRNLPLQGVVTETEPQPAIAVLIGDGPKSTHLAHVVRNPVSLSIEHTVSGATASVHVCDQDGTMTTIELQSPVLPEQVDGVPFPA